MRSRSYAMTDERETDLFGGSAPAFEPTVEDPEAPYGRKADGTPKKRRGRPKKAPASDSATTAAVPPTPSPAPKETAAQAVERELGNAVASGAGWWSAEADAARCERARHAARHWIDVAAFAVHQGEQAARGIAAREMVRQGHSPQQVTDHLARVPWMRDVPMRFGARDTNCEEVNAQALAFVAGYFAPVTPDHPLAQAAIALAASFGAYSRAIRESLAAPRHDP